MDDEDDGQDSRAPTIEDLARVCDSLNRAEAQYVLIGGFAVIAHGAASLMMKRRIRPFGAPLHSS